MKINVYGGQMEEQKKSVFKSKTLWMNLLVAVLAFFPAVSSKVSPEYIMQGLALLNIILRFVTKDKVFLIE